MKLCSEANLFSIKNVIVSYSIEYFAYSNVNSILDKGIFWQKMGKNIIIIWHNCLFDRDLLFYGDKIQE